MGGGGPDVSAFGVEDDGEVEGFGFGDDMLEYGVSSGSETLEARGLRFDDTHDWGDEIEDC